jgi:prepilin-type N-terminal cleavage/methylation domain-containing protein
MRERKRAGFTLLELLLVSLILGILAALLFPVLAQARKEARMARCTANLRQLGMACSLYAADYGGYPDPYRWVHTVPERGILYCPEDRGTERAASSYTFRSLLPPDLRPYWETTELPPNTVVAICGHHQEQAETWSNGRRQVGPARYPYKLVLRASGAVARLPVGRIREFFVPGDRPSYVNIYPGETGYDQAMR